MAGMSSNSGAAPQWSSRFAFLMAAIGSSVGLGNLWRFPFQTGQNGGSAFVFIYLLCVVFVAYPILMSELAVGRHKGLSAVGSTRQLALDAGRSKHWGLVGWVGVIAAFGIVATYSVIAGQVAAYSLMAFLGEFAGRDPLAASQATSLYDGPWMALGWHGLFMGVTVFIVAQNIQSGVERVCTVLMPIFFLMLTALCVYALSTGAASETMDYLFAPRFSEVTPGVILAALGQAFFSVGVGAAILLTYGSFLPKDVNIGVNAGVIAGADTLVAVVAGLMIFPIVFANGLDPAAGAGLIFGALPAVFSDMPGGSILGGVFFLLALVAAITSSISLLIGVVMVGVDQLRLSRSVSAMLFGAVAFCLGAVTIAAPSFAPWIDFVSGSILLPLGGLLVAILSGWVAPRKNMREELHNTSEGLFRFWRFFVRYAAPVAVMIILILGVDAKFDFGINAALSGVAGA
ncbi:sodium-dependent transporter [Hyphococcus sp.]|uniref:sodium-dependent transporter n=1 Tax=Hyphococcus sp. TaxID=2038636 RepID=UPI0035C7726B